MKNKILEKRSKTLNDNISELSTLLDSTDLGTVTIAENELSVTSKELKDINSQLVQIMNDNMITIPNLDEFIALIIALAYEELNKYKQIAIDEITKFAEDFTNKTINPIVDSMLPPTIDSDTIPKIVKFVTDTKEKIENIILLTTSQITCIENNFIAYSAIKVIEAKAKIQYKEKTKNKHKKNNTSNNTNSSTNDGDKLPDGTDERLLAMMHNTEIDGSDDYLIL